ncbi:hypothetical protein ACFE04_009017 [Oxalis oulophora]
MGSCLTKKVSSPSVTVAEPKSKAEEHRKVNEEEVIVDEGIVNKGILVIEHSNEDTKTQDDVVVNNCNISNSSVVVRTSSCSREEVDAILIQCGRLSRCNSPANKAAGAATPSSVARKKCSGSKRSSDFDHESLVDCDSLKSKEFVEEDDEILHGRRQRQPSASPSKGRRRRTPSRERDQTRGRHVSRSPVKRSESNPNSGNSNRPSKMVSVPARVSSLAMDKSNNPEQQTSSVALRKISVKSNVRGDGGTVAGSRTVASPRSRSPGKANQQPSLSRSSSRKEHSPYRRNPLGELDTNSLVVPANNKASMAKPNTENNEKIAINNKSNRGTPKKKAIKQVDELQEQIMVDEAKTQPQITRSRSSRLSRDLDINPESLMMNPKPSSYTSRLLEDIQNFHQKNSNNNNNPSFSLPASVTKACSIVDAVANLNSTTSSSNMDDLKKNPTSNVVLSKDRTIVESEVLGSDDLMEPSFHKYVTVSGEDQMDEKQESSGSNSIVDSTSRSNASVSKNNNRTGVMNKRKVDNSDHNRKQTGIGRGRMGTTRTST